MKTGVWRIYPFILILALVVSLHGPGTADGAGQSSANYAVQNDVMSGGGPTWTSVNYTLASTIAQPSPIGSSSSTNYTNHAGFRSAIQKAFFAVMIGDMDGDGDVDAADAAIAVEVVAGGSPSGIRPGYASSGADVNGDDRIGMEEVLYILEKLHGKR